MHPLNTLPETGLPAAHGATRLGSARRVASGPFNLSKRGIE